MNNNFNEQEKNFLREIDNPIQVSNILHMLIRYASDVDIMQLLKNCVILDKKCSKALDVLCNKFDGANKAILIYLMIYCFACDYSSDHKLEILAGIVCLHLKAIAICFYNYGFMFGDQTKYSQEEQKDFENLLAILQKGMEACTGKTCDITKLNDKYLSEDDLKTIFNLIINNYTKYHFYYCFNKDNVVKLEINKENEEMYNIASKFYKLVNTNRYPHIIEPQTGFKFLIGRTINLSYKITEDEMAFTPTTKEVFKRTNKSLVKALSYDYRLEPCHWCEPDFNKKNEKKKCDNCKNLLEELNKLKEITENQQLKYTDFNRLISSIKYKDNERLADLRKRRKEALLSLIKDDSNKEQVQIIKKLLDICFTNEVVIKDLDE